MQNQREENTRALPFLEQKFAEYYQDNIEHIQPPESMERREFGFILFRENMMVRHKGFRSEEDFRRFLASTAPSDVYYSSAYYERPDAPMEKKGWLGADLIFDIDSDHIETPCKSEHEYWICKSCELAGRGKSPGCCPRCGGSSFKQEAWLCESCLESAKAETFKLVDFLTGDFGFSPEGIEVCFSGQRGYHVRVGGLEVRQLDQAARKEITDYISGTGLIVELHGLAEVGVGSARELVGPDLNDYGWDGRIARGVYGLLSSSTLQQLEQKLGITEAMASTLIANRDMILREWSRRVPWGAIKGIGLKTWKRIMLRAIREQAAIIDTVVTTDMHRLIRLPLSLHGKTGLKAVNVSADALERFDPLKDAVAFRSGTLKVHVNEANRFRIGDEEFGPYTRETVTLPMAAAIYMLCKKVAEPASP